MKYRGRFSKGLIVPCDGNAVTSEVRSSSSCFKRLDPFSTKAVLLTRLRSTPYESKHQKCMPYAKSISVLKASSQQRTRHMLKLICAKRGLLSISHQRTYIFTRSFALRTTAIVASRDTSSSLKLTLQSKNFLLLGSLKYPD